MIVFLIHSNGRAEITRRSSLAKIRFESKKVDALRPGKYELCERFIVDNLTFAKTPVPRKSPICCARVVLPCGRRTVNPDPTLTRPRNQL